MAGSLLNQAGAMPLFQKPAVPFLILLIDAALQMSGYHNLHAAIAIGAFAALWSGALLLGFSG